eukprot:6189630-Pleurochrysis_carterae.AAC.2
MQSPAYVNASETGGKRPQKTEKGKLSIGRTKNQRHGSMRSEGSADSANEGETLTRIKVMHRSRIAATQEYKVVLTGAKRSRPCMPISENIWASRLS